MGFEKTTGIQWTNLELMGLLEDNDSCVYFERIQKHLGLHPFHFTNLNEALREILNANLNSYDPDLNGFLLSYKNPKIVSPLGGILYDTCFIHIDLEADFYIFRPEVGRSIKGFVNKKGTNHIGILVHKAFNVSVPKPNDLENQENSQDWPGDKVAIGQEVKFRLDEIDYRTRLPYIRGLLFEEEYLNGCQLFNEQIMATYESEFYKITRWNGTEKSSDNTNITPKKENQRIVFNSDSDIEVEQKIKSEKKSVKKLKIKDDIKEPFRISPKKRKRKSCTSESELVNQSDKEQKVKMKRNLILNDLNDSDLSVSKYTCNIKKKNLVQNDNSFNKQENNKKQKSVIKNIDIFNDLCDIKKEVPNGRIKENKKVFSNSNTNDNSYDENDKDMIVNLTNECFDNNFTFIGNDEILLKKSKKHKKKFKPNNIDDKKKHTLEITKSPVQKLTSDDEIKVKLELELSKTESRKRKRSSIEENTIINNVKDEEHDGSKTELIETTKKKRSKKHKGNDMLQNFNSKDEKQFKKSAIKNLSDNLELDESNNKEFELPKKKSKKRNELTIIDDILMDSENEKEYKSTLKTLIKTEQNNEIEKNSEFIEHKQKKSKKKYKTCKGDIEFEFNTPLVKDNEYEISKVKIEKN